MKLCRMKLKKRDRYIPSHNFLDVKFTSPGYRYLYAPEEGWTRQVREWKEGFREAMQDETKGKR